MKKTLLASAIAAATFSGAAFAEGHESNMPSFYGNIQYALTHVDVSGDNDAGTSGLSHDDNGSTLGLTHSHEIAPGVTGFYKLETEVAAADEKGGGNALVDLDEAYIGIKGDSFGQVWVGSDDGTYERAVVIIGNFHEYGSDIFSAGTTGEGDQLQYMSPSLGGLTLGASVSIYGDNDDTYGGGKSYPWQFSATYEIDALSVAFAVDSNEAAAGSNENTYGLAATYSMGGLSLVGEYQTRSDVEDIYGVMATYAMGANQFNIAYQVQDLDNGDANDTVTLQALHNLSDHMYVYAEGYISSGDAVDQYSLDGVSGDEQTIGVIGAVYYF